jgi:class 3 adenylate cyclase
VSLVATIAGVEARAFETADQAADSAIAMLRDGERLSRVWRYVFVQMLDDYTSVLRHSGVSAAARMWSGAPRRTGDSRVDAAFAAMAEYLARRDGWMVPSWARLPEREAWPWWFVTDLRGLHARALVESPSSFRRRGVFITSGGLDRA